MARAVYIGGFGNGKANAERVANVLGEYYEDVEPFTFSSGISNPNRLRRFAQGVDVYTHSAGMLALREAAKESLTPESIVAFGAPLPSTRLRLVRKTIEKTVHMHMPGRGIRSASDVTAVFAYGNSSIAELGVHPVRNLRQLVNGSISRFDAVKTAVAAQESGIQVALAYNEDDDYFRPTVPQRLAAATGGVDMLYLPGEHDELVLRPVESLANFMNYGANR